MRSTENVPARSWPKRKLAPTQTSATCSHSTSTVRTNRSGSHDDSSCVKRTTATPCMPARPSASSFCSVVISSGGALSGRSTRERMRIEGHRGRRAAALARAAPHAVDDLHVPAVQPVEVAERQHRLVPPDGGSSGKWAVINVAQAQGSGSGLTDSTST